MKAIAIVLFLLLLLPIYALPWLQGLADTVSVTETIDAAIDDREADQELIESTSAWATGTWIAEAVCYAVLMLSLLIFARGARWVVALILFAATFDLVPVLDLVPLVPTVMFIIAFVFVAKAERPKALPGCDDATSLNPKEMI